jgi:nucleoside-diphosphate-sugar epimerase
MGYILVTGCNGFIGKRLTINLLQKGYKVLGISSNKKSSISNPNFSYLSIDITNCIELEKVFSENDISSVIHLAAIAHTKKQKKIDWNEYYRVNTLASKTIFQSALKTNADILFVSTVDVYGNGEKTIFTEESKPKPISNYGKSKYLAENILSEMVKDSSSDYVIARLAPVYAKGFMKDIYKRIYLKRNKVAFNIGKGTKYQFVSINNVIDFIVNWLESDKKIKKIVNVCDSDYIDSKEFIDYERNIGNASIVFHIPKVLFTLLKISLDISFRITKLPMINNIIANINKVIEPSKYSIDIMEELMKPKWNLKKTVYDNFEN